MEWKQRCWVFKDEYVVENKDSYGRVCMGTTAQHDKVVNIVGQLVHTSQQHCIVLKHKNLGVGQRCLS